MIAAIVALVGAIAALVYGGYAVTARRGVFADLADDAPSVSGDTASASDTTNAVLLVIALVLVLLAVALWVAVLFTARRGRNPMGYGAFGVVGVGAVAAFVGGLLSSGVDDVADAGKAATAYILVGVGFVLIALGLLLGAVAMRRPPAGGDSRPGAPVYGGQPPQYGQAPQGPYGSPQFGGQGGRQPGPPDPLGNPPDQYRPPGR